MLFNLILRNTKRCKIVKIKNTQKNKKDTKNPGVKNIKTQMNLYQNQRRKNNEDLGSGFRRICN